MSQQFAIIGGGITGLAAALQLERGMPQSKITLFESSDRLGGVLRTRLERGFLIEQSADMFTTESGTMLDLCRQLGAEQELIKTRSTGRRAFVARGNRLYPVPAGFSMMMPSRMDSILESEILEPAARLRLLAERWVPRRNDPSDESLQSFAVRRFGQQAFERLIQPLIGGVYSADPKKLSMLAALGRFVDSERAHGSLILAAKSANPSGSIEDGSSGARYGMFLAMKNGMQSLVERMANHLTQTQTVLRSKVRAVTPVASGGWRIQAEPADRSLPREFDGLILATPADVTGKIMELADPPLARQLSGIESASMAIVVMGLDAKQIPRVPDGFGFVVPEIENRNLVACSFASHKFAGRAPQGKVLVRCFIGGSLHADRVALDDQQLVELARQDLAELIGLAGEPEYLQVIRWRNCMPQYHVGHMDRFAILEKGVAAHPALEVAGNSYQGVGIPACVASGQQAAIRLAEQAHSTN